MIKKLLPLKLKHFLWWLIKSPQRKWLGYHTVFIDLRAFFMLLFRKHENDPVSICVGVKNRSRNLLECLVISLNNCENKHMLELSVFNCGSSDIANLEEEIRKIWKGKLVFISEEMNFERSKSFNMAINNSTGSLIMACDADMKLPVDIVAKINRYCNRYAAWFPHVWYVNEDGNGRYYTESTGMFASRREEFRRTGGYDETIKEWGKEDWLLYFEFYKKGIACIRTDEKDFVHRYHPSLKPEGFIPLF